MILNPHRGVGGSRSNKSEIKPVSRDLLPVGHYLYKTGALSLTIVAILSIFQVMFTEKKYCAQFLQFKMNGNED